MYWNLSIGLIWPTCNVGQQLSTVIRFFKKSPNFKIRTSMFNETGLCEYPNVLPIRFFITNDTHTEHVHVHTNTSEVNISVITD